MIRELLCTKPELVWDILERPHDDALRLAFADALDDSHDLADHDRAHLIRLMIAGTHPDEVEWLIGTWEDVWLGSWWPRDGMASKWKPVWSRGFVSAVTMSQKDLERYGDALFMDHPITVVHGPRGDHADAVAVYRDRVGLPPLSAVSSDSQ